MRALLDSGSLGDFISNNLADQLHGSRSKVNYGVTTQFQYQQVKELRYFDIIPLHNYDMILGTPFLHQHRVAVGMNPPRVVIGSNESLRANSD